MKVNIEIDCTDVEEIYTHLSVIRSQLEKKFKKLWKEQPDTQWAPFTVEDNNCYGIHTCESSRQSAILETIESVVEACD